MRKVLLDTNIVLDVLLDREPWAGASAAVWASIETGVAEGLLAAHAVTTIHYLLRKETGNATAQKIVSSILGVLRVAPVDAQVLQDALQLPLGDFEDAVTATAAHSAGCDCIVTRDPKGFRGSPVRSLTPEAVLPILSHE